MFCYDKTEHQPTDAERQEAVAVLRLGSEHTTEGERCLQEALAALRLEDEQVEAVLALLGQP